MPFPAVNRRFMRPWARNGQHIGGRRTSQGRQLTGNILGRFIGGGIPGGRRSILLAVFALPLNAAVLCPGPAVDRQHPWGPGRPARQYPRATSQGRFIGGGLSQGREYHPCLPRAADKPVSLGGRQSAVNILGNILGAGAAVSLGGRRSILLALGRPPFFPATSQGGRAGRRGGIPGGRRSILLALGRPPFFPATSLGGPGRPARQYPWATSQGRR